MKYLYFFCFLLFFIAGLNAQNSGRGFSYQAVARGSDGQVKAKEYIEIQFALLLNAQALTPVWQETHAGTTDEFGIFSLTIGKGIKSGGTAAKFTDVNFAASEFWLRVELKDKGTWQEISKTQLLSVPYAEVAGNAQPSPTGSIMVFAGPKDKVPNGWLLCDGKTLNRGEYRALYEVIGTAWGAGDGANTFHLPDLRGLFLRGVDYNRGHDDGRTSREPMNPGGNTNDNVGSLQRESFRNHDHSGNTTGGPILQPPTDVRINTYASRSGFNGALWMDYVEENLIKDGYPDRPYDRSLKINPSGGNETRPDNAYVNYIIKL